MHEVPGCTAPGEESPGGPRQTPGMGHTPESAPDTAIEGMGDRSPSAKHPSPTGHSELLWLKVFPLAVLLSSKATTWTARGREQARVSTHARFPKGITGSVTPCGNRLAWQAELLL